jgi:AraC family transcriptional regulator
VLAAIELQHEPESPSELSERVYPAGLKLKLDDAGTAYFCFLVTGPSLSVTSHGTAISALGPLVFFPIDGGYELDFAEPTRCLLVRVGPAMLGRFRVNWKEFREVISLQDWEASWLIKRLQSEFVNRHPARDIAIEAIILQLLALTARTTGSSRQTGESFWLKKVRALLDTQYLGEHPLCDLASLAGVHRVHLVREFRKHYGITIGQHIRKRRIAHACELLARTDLLLREIAAVCRFVDQSHFSRQFKKLSGLTPAEYRDLIRSA